MKTRAYTLVEVIIVCGILAVIMAILMPVFTSAKGKAQEAVCVSNLRQLGLAQELYREDNQDYSAFETTAFKGYLNGAEFRCPAKQGKKAFNFRAYTNLASFVVKTSVPELKRHFQAMRECFDKRGAEYPLLIDLNHLPRILRNDNQLYGVVLVYRVGGAVETLPKQRLIHILEAEEGLAPATTVPCSPDAQYANL